MVAWARRADDLSDTGPPPQGPPGGPGAVAAGTVLASMSFGWPLASSQPARQEAQPGQGAAGPADQPS